MSRHAFPSSDPTLAGNILAGPRQNDTRSKAAPPARAKPTATHLPERRGRIWKPSARKSRLRTGHRSARTYRTIRRPILSANRRCPTSEQRRLFRSRDCSNLAGQPQRNSGLWVRRGRNNPARGLPLAVTPGISKIGRLAGSSPGGIMPSYCAHFPWPIGDPAARSEQSRGRNNRRTRAFACSLWVLTRLVVLTASTRSSPLAAGIARDGRRRRVGGKKSSLVGGLALRVSCAERWWVSVPTNASRVSGMTRRTTARAAAPLRAPVPPARGRRRCGLDPSPTGCQARWHE